MILQYHHNNGISIIIYIYRKVLTFVDQFMNLYFMTTSASPAARRIPILPINQYACWPITFRIK
jgi:hypothetical protein